MMSPEVSPGPTLALRGVAGRFRLWLVAGLFLSLGLLLPRGRAADGLEVHRFRFFIHPEVIGELPGGDLQRRLALYVDDLNTIFAKQTIRRFSFDPETDITITTNTPHTGSAGDLPAVGYEIWAHVSPSANTNFGTHGGYMSFDVSGAGVAAGLHWDAVHDRDALPAGAGSWELTQYWRQIHHLTHELEHIFGAGVSEYYSLRIVRDTTGLPPILDIDSDSSSDPFWLEHADYLFDPLALWTPDLPYSNLIAQVRFADVTAAIINARVRLDYDRTLPDLSQTRILIRDGRTGAAIPGAAVGIWKVRSFAPYDHELLALTNADSQGVVQFAWSGAFNNYDHLMLIKAWSSATHLPGAKWASIFDAQAAKMLAGQGVFEVPVDLAPSLRLQIRQSSGSFLVEWPITEANLVLQATAGLVSPAWTTLTNTVTTNGGNRVVRFSAPVPTGFFRLAAPP